MRSGDKLRLGTIRRARAALKNAEIEARGPLSDDAAVKVLRGIVKQHRESIEQFRAGGRDDLVDNEEQEMAVIEAYLPAQIDAAAIDRRRGRGDRRRGRVGAGRHGQGDEGRDGPRSAARPTGKTSERSHNACWEETDEHHAARCRPGRGARPTERARGAGLGRRRRHPHAVGRDDAVRQGEGRLPLLLRDPEPRRSPCSTRSAS